MKPLPPFVLLALACLASSCNERQSATPVAGTAAAPAPAAGYCLPVSTAWAEEEYTQWMTRAELQFFQDQTPPGQYFVHVEGRNHAGLSEYRAVRKPLPADQYAEAAVFWGLSEKDTFDNELRLLRAGYVRKSMQVYVDASGNALHQIVWVRPAGTPPAAQGQVSPPPDAPVPPETMPADATAGTDPSAPEPEASPPADPSPPEEKPPVAVVVPPVEPPARPAPEPLDPKKFTTYTVVQGDILEKIARRQHTTVEAIMAANNLNNDSLHIGQKLKIPKK